MFKIIFVTKLNNNKFTKSNNLFHKCNANLVINVNNLIIFVNHDPYPFVYIG
ncbi:hypothetical protein NBRC110019_10300 [Neptunitalea chrysea]|uniref:Uncharacterized protein n=1 Tax=Neptunitalea chrysea TaxID=1647581 RepID=A0A9W6B3J4_9FLAO|nr:hypothetical protein NBRC110019_10300 [Neptunitalea chrysea]